MQDGRVPVVYRCEHMPAISGTWRTQRCDANSDARPIPWLESSSLYPTAGPGGRAHWLTGTGFSMTVPARQGCTDGARPQACMLKAMNPAASAPSCAGVRSIRTYALENPLPGSRFPGEPKRTGERQAAHGRERRQAGRPGAGGEWNPPARSGGGATGVRGSILRWVSLAGDGPQAGRKEGRCLQFEVHVDRLYFRIERRFLDGIAFRPA